MTGYHVIGTLTVNVIFVALLGVGFSVGALESWRAAVFVLLWLAGYVGLPHLSFGGRVFGSFLFVPYVVLLDVILMIVIIRGDDKLS
jgi:hypothetical protein